LAEALNAEVVSSSKPNYPNPNRRGGPIEEPVRTRERFEPHGSDFSDLVEYQDISKMTPLHYASFEGIQ